MTRLRYLALVMALGLATPLHAALLAPGDAFPAWKLADQTGALVSSRALAGKTYLLGVYGTVTPATHAKDVLGDLSKD